MTAVDGLGDLVEGDRLYAPVEMAHIVHYSQTTIQILCRKGGIKATKMGTQWRITRSEIARFIREGPRTGDDIVDNYKSGNPTS